MLFRSLTPDTVLHVFTDKGAKCVDRQVHTQVLDLSHARVTVDRECLWQPGVLSFSPEVHSPSYADYSACVASRTSPTLKSVSPLQVRADVMQSQLLLTVRGKGFNEHSQVYAGPSGTALATDFAIRHPDRVEALFLIGPVVHGMRSSDYFLQRGNAASAPLEKNDIRGAADN